MDTVNWKDAFRSRLETGITKDSVFYQVTNLSVSTNTYKILEVIPRLGGFYFLMKGRGRKYVDLYDGESWIRWFDRKEADEFTGEFITSAEGEVLMAGGSKWFNLDTKTSVRLPTITAPLHIQALPGKEVMTKISNLGWVSRYECMVGPQYLVRWNDGPTLTLIDTDSNVSRRVDKREKIDIIRNVHYYRDKLYSGRVWEGIIPDDELNSDEDLHFCGMYSIEISKWDGIIFIYNLRTREVFFLNTTTLKLYPLDVYKIPSHPGARETKSFRKAYFTTIRKVLYIVIQYETHYKVISHR